MARLNYLLLILIPLCVFAQPEWQGTYFGINLGAANIDVNPQTSTVFMSPGYFQPTSPAAVNEVGNQHAEDWNFTTGIQMGYNWQWSRFVLGLEIDGSYLPSTQTISDSAKYPCCDNVFTIETKTDTEWQATARPRLGYAFEKGPLFYITGGLAVAGVSSELDFHDYQVVASGDLNETVVSWVAGGGFEVLMSKSSIFRAEYLFSEYTTDQITIDNMSSPEHLAHGPFNPMFLEASYKVHMIRLGLNLKL